MNENVKASAAQQETFDVLVAGGGMVGATLAHALGGAGLNVAVVEAHEPGATIQPSYDDRAIALAWGTRTILESLGLWSALESSAEPILRIHVSDRGHFGFARLDCRDEGTEALGYVVTGRELGRYLLQTLESRPGVSFICPARLESFQVRDDAVEARVLDASGSRVIVARLLVAADGGKSMVRERLGVAVREKAYAQTAIVSNVTPSIPHAGVAYERFTETGPLALLPMTEGRCGLVWTVADEMAVDVLAWDDTRFLRVLQERFGYRLGALRRVGKRSSYPLRLVQAKEHVRPRVALIGNAAHTLHPVAGQGFNLGIRDAAVLAEVVTDAIGAGADPGDIDALRRYAEWRRRDQVTVARFTDGLVHLFVHPFGPLKLARNLGLIGVDCLPGLKSLIARQAMGLRGRLPRLARGLPVD